MIRGRNTACFSVVLVASLILVGIGPAVAQTAAQPFVSITSATIEPGGTVAIIGMRLSCPKGVQLPNVAVSVGQRRSSTETITEAGETFAVHCTGRPTSVRAPTGANFPATRGLTGGPALVTASLSWFPPNSTAERLLNTSGTFVLMSHATSNPSLGAARRLARGAALVVHPHVTCPDGRSGEIVGELSQRLPNGFIQLQSFNFVNFDCTGAPEAISVTLPAGAYAWGTGKTFLWVQSLCVADCVWGNDFGTIGVTS